jgi:hypothetical protein
MIAINYFAVLTSALVAMVVGSLWYSPVLFGKQWMQLRGIHPKNKKGMSMPAREMLLEFVGALVTAYVLDILVIAFGAYTAEAAFLLALVVWLGFYVTQLLSEVLWEKKPFGVFLITAGLRLVSLLLMTLILGLW